MIIFDLDGTLADCEHRRHLLNPEKYPQLCEYSNYRIIDGKPILDLNGKASWRYKATGKPFEHGWKEFYEACDKDKPIEPVIDFWNDQISLGGLENIMIWSGRCESVREKTEKWLEKNLLCFESHQLKMRPIGDTTPDDELKEKWLNQHIDECVKHENVVRKYSGQNYMEREDHDPEFRKKGYIDVVFDDRPKVIRMWRRHGIFVFNCCQHDEEF